MVDLELKDLRELRELRELQAAQAALPRARKLVAPGRERPVEQQEQHLELSEQAPQEWNLRTVAVLGHQEFDLD